LTTFVWNFDNINGRIAMILYDVMVHIVTVQGIKDLMEGMNDKEALIHIRNTNHQRLLEELESLVVCNKFIPVLTPILLDNNNKKLSYRRETARQLHMTTWAGQLTF